MDKKEPRKEVRMQLIGTPEEIAPHLTRVAKELECQGFNYLADQIPSRSERFSKEFRILCGEYVGPTIRWLDDQMDEKTQLSTYCIGIVTLQSLANSRTLLIIKKQEPAKLENAELYFNSFLDRFRTELKQLGFIENWLKKTWHTIKELLGVAKAVKP
jgi:hypothetical protein